MFSTIGSVNSAFQGQQASAANSRALTTAPTSAVGPTAASASAQDAFALKTGSDGRSLVATDLQPVQRVDDKTAADAPGTSRTVNTDEDTTSRALRGKEDGELGKEAGQNADAPDKAELETKLDETELRLIQDLASRDREVKTHEQAHASVGGAYAGAPSYTYTRGPDGKQYATGGEVSIDTGAIEGDPDATIDKMQQVVRAALAPAEPSAQDRKVAAAASQAINAARAELAAMEKAATESQIPEETEASAIASDTEEGNSVVENSDGSGGRAPSSLASEPTRPANENAIQPREMQRAIATYQQIFTAA
ncbi:putative metalloprotease CJM1_0395 family protein [Allohahella marinimesophila]|uniref:SprA-related family protein n=1 Tax=Allohahella marinimesophila TaxID=1054972 RepID=A0ABP7PR93_9GAMM